MVGTLSPLLGFLMESQSVHTTFRSPAMKVPACFLPYKPAQGSAVLVTDSKVSGCKEIGAACGTEPLE
jgi:hypothetical protein